MAVPTPSTEEHAVVQGRAVPEGARHTGPGPDDEFLVALAKNGRTDAYDQLVRRYRRFVRVKSSSYFLLGGDADDLMQEGMLGLFKAIRDYRPERESSFRGFAELCITRQIITAVKTATRNKHTALNQYVSFSQTPAAAGVWLKETYWLSGVCLLRVAVFTAVMICRVMQSSAKPRKLDSRSGL